MSSYAVRQSFNTRLQDFINGQGWAIPIIDIENKREQPNPDEDWMCIEYIGADEEQISTGAPGQNCFREIGDVLIHYVTRSKTGSDTTFQRLEAVRSHFRFTIIDCVTINAVSPPDSEPGASLSGARGNWWGASIQIEYEYDIRG